MGFKDIRFGYVSAEKESSDDPSLLLDGYFDLCQAVDQVLAGRVSLCLGYKGTGKTALSERLSLLSDNNCHLFTRTSLLSDFPYGSLREVVVRDSSPEASYPDAWAWLLLLCVIDSLEQDEGKALSQSDDYEKTIRFLRELKLLPAGNLAKLVQVSSSRSVKAKITAFEAEIGGTYGPSDVPMFVAVEHLRRVVTHVRSRSKHIIFIDGLDQVFASGQKQFRSLSTLVNEAVRLNNLFRRKAVPATIVVLCRTDLFDLLPDANKNKIRQDEAVDFDWYQAGGDIENLYLTQMIQLRASLSDPGMGDVFERYFPAQMPRVTLSTPRHLLQFTRYTPRDFIALLRCIQRVSGDSGATASSVDQGIINYCITYFLPELRDQSVGLVSQQAWAAALAMIGSLRKDVIYLRELKANLSGYPDLTEENLAQTLKTLFDSNALGTVRERSQVDASGSNLTAVWKYRRRNAALDLNAPMLLHRAFRIGLSST